MPWWRRGHHCQTAHDPNGVFLVDITAALRNGSIDTTDGVDDDEDDVLGAMEGSPLSTAGAQRGIVESIGIRGMGNAQTWQSL